MKLKISIMVILVTVVISLIIIIPSVKETKRQEAIYNDYVAVSNAKSLSTQKDLEMLYNMLYENEKYYDIRVGITKQDIIFDFKESNYLSFMDYIEVGASDSELIESFTLFSSVLSDKFYWDDKDGWNGIIDLNENDDLMAKYVDEVTVEVQIGKYVVTKESLQNSFNDYVDNHFDDQYYFYRLLLSDSVFNTFVTNSLSVDASESDKFQYIEQNYSSLYYSFSDLFNDKISYILVEFTRYFEDVDEDNLEFEYIISTFIVRRNVELRNMPSKYYTYNWSVDVAIMIESAETASLPLLYY